MNECDPASPLHCCNQICENTLGGYTCSCRKGYKLTTDGYECRKGKSDFIVIINLIFECGSHLKGRQETIFIRDFGPRLFITFPGLHE